MSYYEERYCNYWKSNKRERIKKKYKKLSKKIALILSGEKKYDRDF